MKIEIIILSRFGTMFGRHIKIQQLYFFMKMGPLCGRGRVTAAFWLVILSSGLPFSSSEYIHTYTREYWCPPQHSMHTFHINICR